MFLRCSHCILSLIQCHAYNPQRSYNIRAIRLNRDDLTFKHTSSLWGGNSHKTLCLWCLLWNVFSCQKVPKVFGWKIAFKVLWQAIYALRICTCNGCWTPTVYCLNTWLNIDFRKIFADFQAIFTQNFISGKFDLPKIGYSLEMAKDFSNVKYYGYGNVENYSDFLNQIGLIKNENLNGLCLLKINLNSSLVSGPQLFEPTPRTKPSMLILLSSIIATSSKQCGKLFWLFKSS